MSTIKRSIALGISDPHSGFVLGLTNPETKLLDHHGNEKPIELNESQKFLWEVYTEGLKKTKELADGDPIDVFVTGDITHGNKYISQQVTTRLADQPVIAAAAISPALQLPTVRSLQFAAGTGAHVFGEGSAEILVSALLREHAPKIPNRVVYHGVADVGNFTVDYSHHGPHPGNRNWLKGNVARLYLQSKMMDDLDAGEIPANLVLRGHYHTYTKAWYEVSRGGERYESWLVIMPPLCLPGDFTRQATQSAYRVSPGVVAFEIINGHLNSVSPFLETLDMRTFQTLYERQ